jgi:hypothetical protein
MISLGIEKRSGICPNWLKTIIIKDPSR